MKKHILISFCLFAMLTGCGIFSKKSVEQIPIPAATTQRVVVDPKSLQSCLPMPALQTPATYETIAQHYITIIGLYGDCAIKQSSSIELIRKLSNLDNP
jgi:hypothetical protein